MTTELTADDMDELEVPTRMAKGSGFKQVMVDVDHVLSLIAAARRGVEQRWVPVEERPLVPGERRVMAVEVIRNDVPGWDVFVAAPSEDEDDEWEDNCDTTPWTPSEVEYSMSIDGLPALPSPPEAK